MTRLTQMNNRFWTVDLLTLTVMSSKCAPNLSLAWQVLTEIGTGM